MLKEVTWGRPWDFYKDLQITFILCYCIPVTNNSLHRI